MPLENLNPAADSQTGSSVTIKVPVSSLKRRDYNGEACCPCDSSSDEDKGKDKGPKWILPEAGDPVDFSIRGTVSSIDGGVATVHVAFVNDKRPEVSAASEVAKPMDQAAAKQKAAGAALRKRSESESIY